MLDLGLQFGRSVANGFQRRSDVRGIMCLPSHSFKPIYLYGQFSRAAALF